MTTVKQNIATELHAPARRNFIRRRIISKGLHDLVQIDLVEMIPHARINKNFKYILIAINFYSKKAYARPLKDKTGLQVTKAMEDILQEMSIPPNNIQSDNGKEFYNKHFKNLMEKNNINHYSTYTKVKAAAVERLVRTLKNMMYREILSQGTYKWLDLLPRIIAKYNNTYHSTIRMKPNDVKNNDLLLTVYNYNESRREKRSAMKFSVGDYVRISKNKGHFEKGFEANWTVEIFQVAQVQRTDPVTYILKDNDGEEIKGAFYGHELHSTHYPNTYLVEKVLRHQGNRILVKWYGFPNAQWIDRKDLL